MEYIYHPSDVCPMEIRFRIENDVVRDIRFTGGCSGNLKAIAKLVDGWTVEQIEEKLIGSICGRRPTSCADQLAKAVRKAYEAQSADPQ